MASSGNSKTFHSTKLQVKDVMLVTNNWWVIVTNNRLQTVINNSGGRKQWLLILYCEMHFFSP